MKILKFRLFEAKNNGVKKHQVDDFVIFQGKSAEANDYITLELAGENDIWMHAKGVPGSHVLIKVNDRLPTLEVIKKAAQIAADNSKADKDSDVVVVYCKKKYVHKRPGMNAGQVEVEYKNSEQITVTKK